MAIHKIRVLVVDDSILFREMLINRLGQDPYIEVVGYAVDSYDAFGKIESLTPDVITLDVEMPKMNGIEFLKKLMPVTPYPVVVVSSMPINALDALEAGAVDFVKKPIVKVPSDLQEFINELNSKIKIASIARLGARKTQETDTPVTKERSSAVERLRAEVAPKTAEDSLKTDKAVTKSSARRETSTTQQRRASDEALRKTIQELEKTFKSTSVKGEPTKPSKPAILSKSAKVGRHNKKSDVSLVAIGASTGGTDAILEVIRELPDDFPCVLVVQHMPAGFTRMFAERLDKHCVMSVKECEDGDRVEHGRIIVAAGGNHMWLEKDNHGYYVRSQTGEKVSGHCPSVDTLFNSVADIAGDSAVGIILTGMGSDGAKGLLKMRKSGSLTIGQDKESSVVYGMPMVSYNIGAVAEQLHLEQIGFELIRYRNKKLE